MRIAHVTDCYLPRLGGIELQVHDLAQRQVQAGHDVTVITSTTGPAAGLDPTNAEVVRLGRPGWRSDSISYRHSRRGRLTAVNGEPPTTPPPRPAIVGRPPAGSLT